MAHWFLSVTHGTARFKYSFPRLSRETRPHYLSKIVQNPILAGGPGHRTCVNSRGCGPAKRPDASVLLERYLPVLSAAPSTATRFSTHSVFSRHESEAADR